MAQHEVVMAGFGGQGLLAIGKILAKAAMDDGLEVTWMPSYGPEMRGGTANCLVIIDEEPIGSPVVRTVSGAVVMNKQSIDKFEPSVRGGGVIVVNTSLIDREVARADLRPLYVKANDVAEEEGSLRSANMVALGVYVAATRVVKKESVEHAIEATFAGKKGVGELNLRAFRRGFDLVPSA